MKQLQNTPSGGYASLIVNTQPFRRRQKYDSWQSHSVLYCEILEGQGASGLFYLFFHADLKGFTEWLYTDGLGTSEDDMFSRFDSIRNYQVPMWPGNWEGEGFNYLFRSRLTIKFPFTETSLWLSTH